MTISVWMQNAERTLSRSMLSSARLDSLILLEDALGKDRAYLLAHAEETLPEEVLLKLDANVAKRANHIPLAYIRGFIEFYGRRFSVDQRVLIPRPETENMIDIIKNLQLPPGSPIIDVGTGSGCIGITTKLEQPELQVHASDIDKEALTVAAQNTASLKAEVVLHQGDLLNAQWIESYYSLIAANLPYVSKDYEISEDAKAEPLLALFADDSGYELIERILPQAAACLNVQGYLLLESDPWQQDRIAQKAKAAGLQELERWPFHLLLQKG